MWMERWGGTNAFNNIILCTHLSTHRGGGTGPADPAAAGPKVKQKPTIQNFLLLNTLTVLINNESTNDTTYYLCKTIALLE